MWVMDKLADMLGGKANIVAAAMRRSATMRQLGDEERAPVDLCANYLLKFVDPARIAVLLDQRREIQAREAREAAGQTGRDAAEVGRNLDDAGTCSKPRVRESGCGLRGPPPPSVERCEADDQLELFLPR